LDHNFFPLSQVSFHHGLFRLKHYFAFRHVSGGIRIFTLKLSLHLLPFIVWIILVLLSQNDASVVTVFVHLENNLPGPYMRGLSVQAIDYFADVNLACDHLGALRCHYRAIYQQLRHVAFSFEWAVTHHDT